VGFKFLTKQLSVTLQSAVMSWSLVAWNYLRLLPITGSDWCERFMLRCVLKGYLHRRPFLNTQQIVFSTNHNSWKNSTWTTCDTCPLSHIVYVVIISFYIFLRLQTVGAIVILKINYCVIQNIMWLWFCYPECIIIEYC